jgi:hypothetical protein
MPSIRAANPSRKSAVARATICNAARQVGVNPQDRAEVLDLAAVAITRLAWRDSPVEDWHADPDSRISNPELMRANAATTRLTRNLLELQVPEPSDQPSHADQSPRHTDADRLFTGIRHALAAPDRRLPDARTVGDLAPSSIELASYTDHVATLTYEWANASGHPPGAGPARRHGRQHLPGLVAGPRLAAPGRRVHRLSEGPRPRQQPDHDHPAEDPDPTRAGRRPRPVAPTPAGRPRPPRHRDRDLLPASRDRHPPANPLAAALPVAPCLTAAGPDPHRRFTRKIAQETRDPIFGDQRLKSCPIRRPARTQCWGASGAFQPCPEPPGLRGRLSLRTRTATHQEAI